MVFHHIWNSQAPSNTHTHWFEVWFLCDPLVHQVPKTCNCLFFTLFNMIKNKFFCCCYDCLDLDKIFARRKTYFWTAGTSTKKKKNVQMKAREFSTKIALIWCWVNVTCFHLIFLFTSLYQQFCITVHYRHRKNAFPEQKDVNQLLWLSSISHVYYCDRHYVSLYNNIYVIGFGFSPWPYKIWWIRCTIH